MDKKSLVIIIAIVVIVAVIIYLLYKRLMTTTTTTSTTTTSPTTTTSTSTTSTTTTTASQTQTSTTSTSSLTYTVINTCSVVLTFVVPNYLKAPTYGTTIGGYGALNVGLGPGYSYTVTFSSQTQLENSFFLDPNGNQIPINISGNTITPASCP